VINLGDGETMYGATYPSFICDLTQSREFRGETSSSGSAFEVVIGKRTGVSTIDYTPRAGTHFALVIEEVNSGAYTMNWPTGDRAWEWMTAKPDTLAADSKGVLGVTCVLDTTTFGKHVAAWKLIL